jgi:ketosteroid isomerase-like protein
LSIQFALIAAAAMTTSVATPAPGLPDAVASVLREYRAAMEARSIERLAAVFDPDLFLFEGTHQNVGWADYRDNHIGPEMKEWSEFKVLDTRVADAVITADIACISILSTYRIVVAGKPVRLAAAESFVLVRREGGWKIRHLHSSGKKL